MNIYIGIMIVIIIGYILVGLYAGKKVANTEDYYVDGRNSGTLLITGTLIASFVSTNTWMGDVGWVYGGNFANELVLNAFCCVGFIFGVFLFGRYLRRSEALTMPSYFAKRFNDPKIKKYSAVILVVSMICYLLSVTTAIGILLSEMTGLSTTASYILAFVCCISFTFYGGSKGVILTDTMMFLIFLISTIIAGPYMFSEAGGLMNLFDSLMAKLDELPQGFLDYHGNFAGAGATDAFGAVMYGLMMGIIYFIVVGISPWQAGRNLMAKTEHVSMRAGTVACIFGGLFYCYMFFEAMAINVIDPTGIEPAETVLIWAAYNVMPKIIGALILSGIMAAGLSSASTFLSLISFSLTNDIFSFKFKNDKDQLKTTRIISLIVGIIALLLALCGLGGVRIIAWLAGTLIASSYAVTCYGSVWSKKLTARGARWSMCAGFVGFLVAKVLSSLGIVTIFYNLLDPFFIGVYCSIIAAIIGSYGQKRTETEINEHNKLHVFPDEMKDIKEYKRTSIYANIMIVSGILFSAVLLYMWALPYNGII